jgi:hypothetical protein
VQHVRNFLAKFRQASEERLPPLPELHETIKKYGGKDRRTFSDTHMLKLHNRANWYCAQTPIRHFTYLYITELQKRGIPMYAHTVLRGSELQAQLRAKGLSNLKDGPHQRGCAVDIVHAYYHWNCNEDFWFYVGSIGEQIIRKHNLPIEWGGRWTKLWDPAHWQIENWKKYPKIGPIVKDETRTPKALLKDVKGYSS